MAISRQVKEKMAQGSFIRKMFEEGMQLKKIYGAANVFDLSIGNPIMEPPKEFSAEMLKIAQSPASGMHRYMENAGYADVREAVAAQLKIDTEIKFTGNEVIMTCGTAGALNAVFKALLNPGEEIITFSPYFFEYDSFADNHQGIIKVIPSDENFVPKFDLFEAGISLKTKAVIINSPNNPTGCVYSEQTMQKLSDILRKKSKELKTQIYVISDDVYCRIAFDGIKVPRMVNYYADTVIVTSFSKDLALPGDRIGYAAVNPECTDCKDVVGGIIYGNRVLGFVNAPALLQHLVRNIQGVTISIEGYQKKRDFLYKNLTEMGFKIVKPQGAFYIFPKAPIADDLAFLNELKEFKVLAVPGTSFKAPGYFRIAYCLDDHTIEGCLEGFRKAAQKFGMG
jgi:aspartate aminotransferase